MRVSRDVVAIELEDLGFAPPGLYVEKRRRWNEVVSRGRGRGGSQTKVERAWRRFGSLGTSALLQGSQSGSVSRATLCDLLEVKAERLDDALSDLDKRLRNP